MSNSTAISRELNTDQGYSVTVRTMSSPDEPRWDEFVRTHENGTFFHLAAWQTLIENELRHETHYILAEAGCEIRGVLPLVHVKSRIFGSALISMPFLVYGGPVAADNDALAMLVAEARSLAEKLDVDYLELRNVNPLPGNWQTKTHYVTFRKRLLPDVESNLKAIPRKQRAMVRKAAALDLTAESDDDPARLYRAMLECKRNLGTPFFSESWLSAIKNAFGRDAEILTVAHHGRPISSVMSFRFRKEILPYYGGGGVEARHLKANDFMYWSLMKKACEEGLEIFDYGRSMVDSGAYRFKKHWGFEPQPLHYQYHLVNSKQVPNLNPSNSRFEFLIGCWKRLPLPIAAILGPVIARQLG